MAQSRFSRRNDDEHTEEKKKSGALGSLAAKAKEKIGGAAENIKGVFSKEKQASRTAEADAPFEIPAEPTPSPLPQEPMQPIDSAPVQEQQPAFRRKAQRSTFDPELFDDFSAEQPAQEAPAAPSQPQLPTRSEALRQSGELYFSERMSDSGFKTRVKTETEEKKRPQYQGRVIELMNSANEDEDGDHYYVPNIDVGNEEQRRRYKKRNRKPLKLWQKGVITGACITAAFVGLIFLTVNLMLIGKMNNINVSGTKNVNDLYFYEPTMVTSILDDSVSISEDDRTRLSKLNDAFEFSELSVMSNKKIQNFLAIGLDETGEADAMIIVSVDEKTKKIRLVNILPELYVPLREQFDSVNYGSTLRQIYTYGGASMLKDTVEDTLKVSIDYYFVLSFTAFETMVNHLGGANITITDEKISNWLATNEYEPQNRFGGTGRFTLNGEEALIYSRMSQPDNSFARAERQKEVISKLSERLTEYSTLELVSVLYNTLSYVTTDCKAGKMLGLCGKLKDYGEYEVKSVTVPISGTYTEGYVGGNYLLASNLTVNANDVQLFLYSNDMTYADGGTELNVMLPVLTDVLDVPEEPVSGSDLSASDVPSEA